MGWRGRGAALTSTEETLPRRVPRGSRQGEALPPPGPRHLFPILSGSPDVAMSTLASETTSALDSGPEPTCPLRTQAS